nr:CrcB family protein [Microbacterium pseudoresistens]
MLLVVVGGMLGTAARLGVGLLVPSAGGFPLATLIANVVGALLISVLAARLPGSTDARVFLGTGVLGGFTTYSAFAVGTVELWADEPTTAAVYVLLTLGLGVAAAFTGLRIGRPRGKGAA